MPAKKKTTPKAKRTVWQEIDLKLRKLYKNPKLKKNPDPSEEQKLISDVSDLLDLLESGLTGKRIQCPDGRKIPGD